LSKKTDSNKKNIKKIKDIKLTRTPIVAVMGHVDHGKTSLLDAIRETSVQEGEAGGITQNTRAHVVTYKGQKITFIDTPGHEAFSAMRSRGAQVTDMVLLVVASDDGVQPQTKESIKFALEAKVPMLVAINKSDLPGKKLEKLRQELSSNGVLVEEHGGDVMTVQVSAVEKTGLDEMLDSILLLAEMSELKEAKVADGLLGTGFVLESSLDEHLGAVTLAIIKTGELKAKQYAVHQNGYDKVRRLLDESQSTLDSAKQGTPVWIIGIKSVLDVGEIIQFVETEKEAKELFEKTELVDSSLGEDREGKLELIDKVSEGKPEVENTQDDTEGKDKEDDYDVDLLSEMFTAADEQKEIKFLNLVIKTDTNGTLEAVLAELAKLDDEEVKVKVLSSGTGDVTERDLETAIAGKAIVLAFQTNIPSKVSKIATKERVLVRSYNVIYELLDEVSDVMDGLGDPIVEEIEVARAKVKVPFQLTNGKYIAGCVVKEGTVSRGYKAYILRDDKRVADGKIISLKHVKKEVKEMKKGQECGILLEPNVEILEDDVIVCFKVEKH